MKAITPKVTVMKDSQLVYPELYMEVFIQGDSYEQRAFAQMFSRSNCSKAESPDKADLVVFTGGSDVDPALYGELPHFTTRSNGARDDADIKLYDFCLERGIPMFGVCRGAQFLHVMNGGKLYQDIDHHNGNHNMWDLIDKKMLYKVSSVHHQSCIPGPENMLILANTHKSKRRYRNHKDVSINSTEADVEAFFYSDTCCLGVQGHPEYRGYESFMRWTLEKIADYISNSVETEMRENNIRLKKDIMDKTMKKTTKTTKTEPTKGDKTCAA